MFQFFLISIKIKVCICKYARVSAPTRDKNYVYGLKHYVVLISQTLMSTSKTFRATLYFIE